MRRLRHGQGQDTLRLFAEALAGDELDVDMGGVGVGGTEEGVEFQDLQQHPPEPVPNAPAAAQQRHHQRQEGEGRGDPELGEVEGEDPP